jgi:tetratricopeptide (TPR) repeat protein
MSGGMQDSFERASTLLSEGHAGLAEQLLRDILKTSPNDENSHALLGHSLLLQGKSEQAVLAFRQLVDNHPHSAEAHVELATILHRTGQIEEAEKTYQRALELNPDFSEAWFFLGNLLMQRQAITEARHCFAQSERCDPFRSVFEQVQHALQKKQFHQAEQLCRQVLQSHPNHPQALHTMAILAEQVSAYEEALKILNRGLNYAPYHVSLWERLVKNLAHLGLIEKAIEAAGKLVSLDPGQWRYHMTLAVELANGGKFSESLQSYDRALELVPENANVHLLRGHVLKTLGRRDECEQAYRKSLQLEKVNGTAYWALADLKSYRFDEDDLAQMTAMLNDPKVTAEQATQAGFALAKSYEDGGDFDKAFEYYDKANRLRPEVNFNPAEYQQSCVAVKQGYSVDTLAKQAETKAAQVIPIFIVGLTRSGSTLLEQILASHSCVEGTMELYSMPRTVRRAEMLAKKKRLSYPEVMQHLTADELSYLGQSYLQETSVFRSDKPYFIDKMPPNFHNVGFIHMILPQAIIIDARRHPLSAGFSNYKQHFAKGYDFSYDLGNIGHYYNNYLSLMDHWDALLPDKVLCVQYEKVVKDTDQQIRKLLTHCKLTFEQACVDFHQNKRAVRTASSEQVRQPIYTRGMQQWRNFEAHLGPLKVSLGEQTLKRFEPFID